MRVLIAPDKFAGTLSAVEAAAAIAEGWRRTAPADDLVEVPLADGGPGFVAVLHAALGGRLVDVDVTGPTGEPVAAQVLVVGTTAYVESAQACGLHLVPEPRDPRITTTYGVGELVLVARDAGARRIVLGLGGSGTNDAGAGLLAALGARASGVDGGDASAVLRRGGGSLRLVGSLDLGPALEAVSGLVADRDFFVAFSPERLFSGAVLENLAVYPKLVGGIGPASTDRAARFYASVLDAEVVAMSSSEAAEFSKLADTTYRDVNIALANEFARAADLHGIDVQEVIAAANSQPYSHIHQPGIGVGGHCIPVYPHLLLSRAPGLSLVETARRVNDGQVDRALAILGPLDGGLAGAPVLVLGITYREGVKELAYSRAIAVIDALQAAGARVSAYDPLLADDEIRALGAEPWHWGDSGPFRAIVTQTADRAFAALDAAWFPALRAVYDGRNSLRALALPEGVAYVGVGVQASTRSLAGG